MRFSQDLMRDLKFGDRLKCHFQTFKMFKNISKLDKTERRSLFFISSFKNSKYLFLKNHPYRQLSEGARDNDKSYLLGRCVDNANYLCRCLLISGISLQYSNSPSYHPFESDVWFWSWDRQLWPGRVFRNPVKGSFYV